MAEVHFNEATDAAFLVPREQLKKMHCRFHPRCNNAVVGIFHVPCGCSCWADTVQALCGQHSVKVYSIGPIICLFNFADPLGEESKEKT